MAQLRLFCDPAALMKALTLSLLSLLSMSLCGCQPATQGEVDSALAGNAAEPYDYYMNGMRTTRFAVNGDLAYRLNATRVTHFPEGDQAFLENPDLLWVGEDQSPWRLSARRGNLRPTPAGDEEQLLLESDVVLVTDLSSGQPMRISTDSLTVLTLSRTASTQAPVSVTSPGVAMQGVGMDLRLEDNHIELLNEVRGTYAP